MNLQVNLGNSALGKDFRIDFLQENLQYTLVQGEVGSGKTIITKHIYNQLINQNTIEEIGFVFLDFTQVDYIGWESTYNFLNPTGSMEKALEYLELIVDLSNKRSQRLADSNKAIFVHFNQNDLFVNYSEETRKLLSAIKPNSNIYFVYLTSNNSELSIPDFYIKNTKLSIFCTSSRKTVTVNNMVTTIEPLPLDTTEQVAELFA